MIAKNFIQEIKERAKQADIKLKEDLRKGLSSIQKDCGESNNEVKDKLLRLRRSLDRESLMNDNVMFTTKTLAQFDDIDPPVLDIIFDYKLRDMLYQRAEANEIARSFKQRDMDPERKVMQKLEKEQVSRHRKYWKAEKSVEI